MRCSADIAVPRHGPPRTVALLEGVTLPVLGDGPAVALALELLRAFGASPAQVPTTRAFPSVRIEGAPCSPPGLPAGVVEVACAYLACAAAPLAVATGRRLKVRRHEVAAWVLMPWVAARAGGFDPPQPRAPWLHGEGALAADLGASWQEEQFAALCATFPALEQVPATELARAAQEWRLPVTAFAARGALDVNRSQSPLRVLDADTGRGLVRPSFGVLALRPLQGVVVCDLTTMWAGPLATGVLAGLGADVVKIEPQARLDGLRHAGPPLRRLGGAPASAQFVVLNGRKRRTSLDLREPLDRTRFAKLVRRSDVIVDSFTPRVMGNLGYPPERLRRLAPDALQASVRAFPPGPRGSWMAYGSGVHAAAGLGDLGDGRFVPAAVSYPDPLAGFALAAGIVAQLWARARNGVVSRIETSLWEAVAPLARFTQPGGLGAPLAVEHIAALAPDGMAAPELYWPFTVPQSRRCGTSLCRGLLAADARVVR